MMENLVSDFLDRLRRERMQIDESPRESLGEASLGRLANLYRIKYSNGSVIAYIKESTVEKGFWGMSPDAVDFLISVEEEYSFEKCFLVLLHKNTDTAYVLSAKEIRELTANKKIAYDGGYKINEPELLGQYSKLTSFESILAKLGL